MDAPFIHDNRKLAKRAFYCLINLYLMLQTRRLGKGHGHKMNKEWNILIDNQQYHIALKKKGKAVINGEELLLKTCSKKSGRMYTEYEIRLGSKTVLLVLSNAAGAQLIVDNRDYETGEEYVSPEMPWWAFIFIVLEISLMAVGLTGIIVGGALGGAMIGVGVVFTMSISCNRKKGTLERILLNIAVFVGLCAVLYGMRVLLSGF